MDGLDDVASWLQSRVFKKRIFLLYTLLVIGLWISQSPVTLDILLLGKCGLLACLLITFRLWDDLSDRTFDQAHSNELLDSRVLLTTQHSRLFVALTYSSIIAVALALLLSLGIRSFLIYLALCIYMTFVYYLPRLNLVTRLRREMLVLFKYPLLLHLLSPVINFKTISVALALYTILLASYLNESRPVDHHSTSKVTK